MNGPAASVDCPVADALRSVWFWLVLAGVLMRKANRSTSALMILLPLLAVCAVLSVAERQLNAFLVFHYHQYLCSVFADLMRIFAVSLAALLAMGDLFRIANRFSRFALLWTLLFLAGVWQIAPNQWPMWTGGGWITVYGLMLLVFLAGHGVVNALAPSKLHLRLCLVLGFVPLLVLAVLEWKLYRPGKVLLQSTSEVYRTSVVLGAALALPYCVFSAYVLLGRLNRLYAQRWANCFGQLKRSPRSTTSASITSGLRPAG